MEQSCPNKCFTLQNYKEKPIYQTNSVLMKLKKDIMKLKMRHLDIFCSETGDLSCRTPAFSFCDVISTFYVAICTIHVVICTIYVVK